MEPCSKKTSRRGNAAERRRKREARRIRKMMMDVAIKWFILSTTAMLLQFAVIVFAGSFSSNHQLTANMEMEDNLPVIPETIEEVEVVEPVMLEEPVMPETGENTVQEKKEVKLPNLVQYTKATDALTSGSSLTMVVTAYCACEECCGKKADESQVGITASGKMAVEGRTVAVDRQVIPLGTKVIIDGYEYTAEDTGGAIKGNRIDVYFNSHEVAREYGRQAKEVIIASEIDSVKI